MRINQPTPLLPAIRRGRVISLQIDGRTVVAYQGETAAAVLLAEGMRAFRRTRQDGQPRGLFCGMGICYECLVTVDGVPNIRACLTPAAEGMRIETQAEVEL
jgi:sarcosine oxidase subunit alpha